MSNFWGAYHFSNKVFFLSFFPLHFLFSEEASLSFLSLKRGKREEEKKEKSLVFLIFFPLISLFGEEDFSFPFSFPFLKRRRKKKERKRRSFSFVFPFFFSFLKSRKRREEKEKRINIFAFWKIKEKCKNIEICQKLIFGEKKETIKDKKREKSAKN